MIEYITTSGDSVDGILYRELGRNDDAAETAFWKLNPTAAEKGPKFPAGVRLKLPVLPKHQQQTAVSPWD